MASSFTKRLNELFTMLQTAPDPNGNRRPFTLREIRTEISTLTGGEYTISERRLRQLKDLDSKTDENPTIAMVTLIVEAIDSLSRKANPDGPHATVDELITFLISGKRAASLDPSAPEAGDPDERGDVVTVMGRYWDLDDEARRRVAEFMDREAEGVAKRRGFLGRRRGRAADATSDAGPPPRR